MLFEFIAIALITAYLALVALGHVLLISAICKCARGDRPKAKFSRTTADWMARLRLSVRHVSGAKNTPANLYKYAAICGVGSSWHSHLPHSDNPIQSHRTGLPKTPPWYPNLPIWRQVCPQPSRTVQSNSNSAPSSS